MKLLALLDFFAELIQLVFEIGHYTRKHIVPALVYTYVFIEHYIAPAAMIPFYYIKVRQQRLACAT